MKRYLWILALPALAAAQIANVELTAPTLGYVWDDQSHSLRPVEGVPGAASLGSAVNLGAPLESIVVAPGRRFALGHEQSTGNLLIIRLDGAVAATRRSPLPRGGIFFSPSGGTAAIANGDSVEVWSGLPDQPVRSQSLSGPDLSFQRVFVSDDGQCVLTLGSGNLHRLVAGSAPVFIGDGYNDVAFLRNSNDLIVAHSSKGVALLRKAEADSEESISVAEGAIAIAMSSDEATLAVLLDGSLVLIDRASLRTTSFALEGITAEGIVRVEGNAVFQLNSTAGNEIWFLDGDSAAPRLVAVTKGAIQ